MNWIRDTKTLSESPSIQPLPPPSPPPPLLPLDSTFSFVQLHHADSNTLMTEL